MKINNQYLTIEKFGDGFLVRSGNDENDVNEFIFNGCHDDVQLFRFVNKFIGINSQESRAKDLVELYESERIQRMPKGEI